MSNIEIKEFDLSDESEFEVFSKYVNDFLSVMSNAYGSNYWSNKIYKQKIEKRRLIISIAYDNSNNEAVGAILVKHRGKLSGIAVIRNYRRNGVARYMLKKMIIKFPSLFVEVGTDNTVMKKLLTSENFKPVNKKSKILQYLHFEKIQILKESVPYLIYYHGDKCNVDRARKFIMYQHE